MKNLLQNLLVVMFMFVMILEQISAPLITYGATTEHTGSIIMDSNDKNERKTNERKVKKIETKQAKTKEVKGGEADEADMSPKENVSQTEDIPQTDATVQTDATELKDATTQEDNILQPDDITKKEDTSNTDDTLQMDTESPKGNTIQEENAQQEDTESKEGEGIQENQIKQSMLAQARINNSINMPESTYKTMILQGAGGSGQKLSASGKVNLFGDQAAIQADMEKNHKEYTYFTPHWTANSTATLSSTSGSVSGTVYYQDNKKAQYAGVFGYPVNGPNIVGGRVYTLTPEMKNNLSCLYTNVGRYYDKATGKSYGIDVKAVLVNYTKENSNANTVKNAIEAGVLGESGGSLFAFTGPYGIGILAAFCDSVNIKYTWYIHGTNTPISIKGYAQFQDIDGQQGIEFPSQAQSFYALNAADQYLGCSKSVYTAGNRAYIYALSSTAFDGQDQNHAIYSMFSGNEISLRFTFAQCSRADDGGNNNGNDLGKYKAPYDTETVRNYAGNDSSGYMGFKAEQPALFNPDIEKTVFNGTDLGKEIALPSKSTTNTLSRYSDSYTYKIRTVCPYEDAAERRYNTWKLMDEISPYLEVENVNVYDGLGQKSVAFNINQEVESDGKTVVTVQAKNPAEQTFYEKSWYDTYISVHVRSQADLEKYNLDMQKLYNVNGSYMGKYVLPNQASLQANALYTSNITTTVLPQKVIVKKMSETGQPVEGIVFGIFETKDADAATEKPLMTAITGADGTATFTRTSFFDLKKYAGPYYVKEYSRSYLEQVYHLDKEWFYAFKADDGAKRIYGEIQDNEENQLNDEIKTMVKGSVIVRKKTSDTEHYLGGAEFGLYQWSKTAGAYAKLCILEEHEDDNGEYFYTNSEEYSASEDNIGKFMIREDKAPYGCYNHGQEWMFSLTDEFEEDPKNITFTYELASGDKKTQSGELIVKNKLQKGVLKLEKSNNEGEVVKDASFDIIAGEDIYAPWQYDTDNHPIKGAEPLVAKGSICQTIKTDSEGKAISDPLYIGTYHVREKNDTPDHIVNQKDYIVTFEYPKDDETETVTLSLPIGNVKMAPAMAVAKIAKRTVNENGEAVRFDRVTGRYIQRKVPGIYQASEQVSYDITITNTGNVDLYHLYLNEDLAQKNTSGETLKDNIKVGESSFVIPKDHLVKTVQEEQATISLSNDNDQRLFINHLKAGDSLTVSFLVALKDDVSNKYDLINKVTLEGSYDDNGKDSEHNIVPVDTKKLLDTNGNSLVEDTDRIHIPGEPDTTVVKTADHTTGYLINEGDFSGFKVPGLYAAGDEVKFSILIKNSGTANLKNIRVSDVLSEELKEVLEEDTVEFRFNESNDDEAELTTGHMEKILGRKINNTEIVLCEQKTETNLLRPDDYVQLYFYGTIKKEVANLYDLENKVIVNGWYYNGERDVEITPSEDTDKIEIPGDPEARIAKLADHTTGTDLVEGRYKGEKVTGFYQNGEIVTYTITVTNFGTANLYNLKVKDIMEERLEQAFEKDSVSFQDGDYESTMGENIKTNLRRNNLLVLDHLNAGDSVDIFLRGKVNDTIGNLFELENQVYVTGEYKKGNENEKLEQEEAIQNGKKEYAVLYHSNNSEDIIEKDSETPACSGSIIYINGNPFLNSGKVFLSWNTKQDGSGETISPGTKLNLRNADANLYAQWQSGVESEKSDYRYNLIYNSNTKNIITQIDSETPSFHNKGVVVDDNYFKNPGYEFIGWSREPKGEGELYRPGDSFKIPSKDVILYAKWKKLQYIALKYHNNCTEQPKEQIDYETPCKKGTEIRIKGNVFEKEGYHFKGWSQDEKATEIQGGYQPNDMISLSDDLDLYAIWEKDSEEDELKYSLIYYGNNESDQISVDEETPCESDTQITLNENRFHYSGYRFFSWNTRPDGQGTSYNPGQTIKMPNRKMNLYAIWNKTQQVALEYCSNYPENVNKTEETFIDSESPCIPGTDVHVNGNPFVCKGYVFLGWSYQKDDTLHLISPDSICLLVKDTMLYAQWTDNTKEYSLIYDSNSDDRQTEADVHSTCYVGTLIPLQKNSFKNPGYSFVGWSESAQSAPEENDILKPGEIYEQPAKNMVLYAVWKKAAARKLTYHFDEEYSIDDETPCEEKTTIVLDASSFEHKGYTFKGWSIQKDTEEQKDGTIYYPGCRFIIKEKDVDLYAIWEKNPLTSFDKNEAEDETKDEIGDEIEEINKEMTAISVTDYMTDEDHINLPGTPEIVTAKKADKTKGVELYNGRYEGTRQYAIYESSDKVDYKITVTNTGTADLCNIEVRDTLGDELLKVVDKDAIDFPEGKYISQKGKEVLTRTKKGNGDTDSIKTLNIDKIEAGDSVELHLYANLITDFTSAEKLNNHVDITAQYEYGKDLFTPVPTTEEMSDDDKISVGQPELKIAKKADKTTGITLKKGRYVGDRRMAIYKKGEAVTYKIIVTNTGDTPAYIVRVSEEPSYIMKEYMSIQGFNIRKGEEITSNEKNKVRVVSKDKNEVILDKIESGDQVEINYTAKVKKVTPKAKIIHNNVEVSGTKKDGFQINQTPQMKDYDNIKVKGKMESTSAKTGDRTNVVWYLLLLTITGLAFFYPVKRRLKAQRQ